MFVCVCVCVFVLVCFLDDVMHPCDLHVHSAVFGTGVGLFNTLLLLLLFLRLWAFACLLASLSSFFLSFFLSFFFSYCLSNSSFLSLLAPQAQIDLHVLRRYGTFQKANAVLRNLVRRSLRDGVQRAVDSAVAAKRQANADNEFQNEVKEVFDTHGTLPLHDSRVLALYSDLSHAEADASSSERTKPNEEL